MKRLTFIALGALTLSACGNIKEQFKYSKEAPDEFAVIKRAPLEMPANLTALPAPQPGAPRPQEQTATAQARASIIGAPASAPTTVTQGEISLLNKAGAKTVPANIRTEVDSETAKIAKEETPTFDRMMGLTGKKVEEYAVEVDPIAETNRLKANKAAGRPLAEGKTATKEE